MTDKELRSLSRAELIDIIYEQQKRLEAQEAAAKSLQEKLDYRELRLSSAGSIAEAALQVNGVFEAAQAAADQYLVSVKAAAADVEKSIEETQEKCQKLMQYAETKATVMIQKAQEQADSITASAQEQCEEKWTKFRQHAMELISAHKELQELVGGAAE